MKAVILFALLAFVAQAGLLDTTSYTLGFDNQLNIGEVETDSGLQCFSSLNDTISGVLSTIQSFHTGAADVAESLFELVATVEGPLKENCQAYATDILTYVANASNVTDIEDLETIVKANAETYAVQLIQQVAIWTNAILAENDYEAGSTEAYIIQILVGAVAPAQPTMPEITADTYVPVNYTALIYQGYSTFFSELGYDGQSIAEAYVECFTNTTVAVPAVQHFVSNFEQADGLDKIEVIRSTFNDVTFVLETCAPVLEVDIEFFVPVFEAIKEDPVRALLTIINNIALNLPQLEQSSINQTIDSLTGKYTQVGQEKVYLVSTIFNNTGY